MKILMINVVCGIRSTGRICTDLAMALESKGHDVKIAYGREKVPEQFQKYAVRIGSDLSVSLHGVQARLADSAGFGSEKATKRFIEWVREYSPDVIHLHNIHGYYINIEILFEYLKECGKKVIWTLHDCWPFTGHSAYCDAISCERWITGCYDCPQSKAYPKSLVDKSNLNWEKKRDIFTHIPNMTIITPSEWLMSLVKKSFLCKYSGKVIPNGVDISQFKIINSNFREKYNLKDKIILLGVATAWNDFKGYSDFVQLSKMLDNQYKIVLVGLTKKQRNEIPTDILGLERTSSIKELAEIYSAADIFLNLTYCDNYPTVNLEAIACGTLVLTYSTGGSIEAVEKSGGIVVEKGNVRAVFEAIKDEKRSLRKPQYNEKFFDKQLEIMNYIELIDK